MAAAADDYRRRLEAHHSRWREAHGHPMGTQPIKPRPGQACRPVGHRLPFDYALETGATFLTDHALAAARQRQAAKEREQSIDWQRTWAELLWSTALGFNLFGDLAADPALADHALHRLAPDTPGRVTGVRFLHSPGRLDADYTSNLIDWHAAFVLDQPDGAQGIVAVVLGYHELVRPYQPKPARLPRYVDITTRSRLFKPRAVDAVNGTDLLLLWLQHLLVLSMLQHPSGDWSWGRLVVVHPEDKTDFANAAARYRALLNDDDTFQAMTLEALLDSGALPGPTAEAVAERYLPSP